MPREYLIQQLWQHKPPATAANALQVHISKVRKLFAPHGVELESNGYRLEPVPTDGDHVRVSLAQATEFMVEGDFLRAAATAHQALDQWRGEPYDGLEGPEVRAQRALFAEVRAQLAQTHLEARIELAMSPIHINEVVAESAGFVARYPQRPAAHELFRHALRKAGRFEEAAAHFEGMIPHDGDPSPLVRG